MVPKREDSLLERLAMHGIVAGSAEIAPGSLFEASAESDDGELIIEKLYSLEFARYLVLVCLAASVAGSAWLVSRSGSIGDLVDGRIAESAVARIDIARRSAVGTIGVALTAVPLWCGVAATWARRASADIKGELRCYALFVVSLAISVTTFVVDGETRGTVSFIGLLVGMVAALWAVSVAASIQRWFNRSTAILTAWPIALAFVIVTSWVGGLQRPIDATDSVEALSFFGALQVVSVTVVLVLATVSTADVEEAIRLSPSSTASRQPASEVRGDWPVS